MFIAGALVRCPTPSSFVSWIACGESEVEGSWPSVSAVEIGSISSSFSFLECRAFCAHRRGEGAWAHSDCSLSRGLPGASMGVRPGGFWLSTGCYLPEFWKLFFFCCEASVIRLQKAWVRSPCRILCAQVHVFRAAPWNNLWKYKRKHTNWRGPSNLSELISVK